jgi:two-component system, OmpR family, sensor kinase
VNLRAKLLLVAAGLVLLGTVLGLTLTYWSLLGLRVASFDDENRLLANLVLESALVQDDGSMRIPATVSGYLTGARSSSAVQVFVDTQLIYSGGSTAAPRPLDAEKVLAGSGASTVREWRIYTFRDDEGGMVVQVGRPLQTLREVLGPFPWVALGVSLVVTALSGALAWLMVGYALRPLQELSAAAERFGEGAAVPDVPGHDESARLARSFAALLTRLKAEREREHRFFAFAAHELRTPLSALRAGLEAVHTGRLAATPEMMARLHREATRLEVLAQNLLALSTAQAGDARVEALDLERIAGDAYDRYLPLALERGLTLTLESEPAPVLGDARLIDQALGNLVSNALRATAQGGLTLRTGVADGRAFLEVGDTGPGIKPQPDGKGLGLRVVRAVAEAHGGTLELDGSRGTRARISLPLPEA